MKKILLTGATGFVGKNILPILNKHYKVFYPDRHELNLTCKEEVKEYLQKHRFNSVLHCANPNPAKNQLDQQDTMFEISLRLFMNFYSCREYFGKMIYLGSGAEYDKTKDISFIEEEDCFRSIPIDSYGFAKYIMNTMASRTDNIYNACVFACYGPYDYFSKFITHCIRCCIEDKPITIRQDCRFDYIHVYDLARMIIWLIDTMPTFRMYNVCSGKAVLLSEIAHEVKKQMESTQPIIVSKEGLNYEYTGSNKRFVIESGIEPILSLEEGISLQIKWETENYKTEVNNI